MKKLISLLIILFIFTGCSQTKPDIDSGFSIETYRADMSGYKGLTSVNHYFLGTTVQELERTMHEKGYGAFVLSRVNCPHCQLAMQYLNKAAKEMGVYVYYIDAESEKYPILHTDNYDLLDSLLKPIEEEMDGEIALQTPHFFTIINGEFVFSKIGISFKDNDNPSDKEINQAVNDYKKALKPFVK